jgi:hypothetical protein
VRKKEFEKRSVRKRKKKKERLKNIWKDMKEWQKEKISLKSEKVPKLCKSERISSKLE